MSVVVVVFSANHTARHPSAVSCLSRPSAVWGSTVNTQQTLSGSSLPISVIFIVRAHIKLIVIFQRMCFTASCAKVMCSKVQFLSLSVRTTGAFSALKSFYGTSRCSAVTMHIVTQCRDSVINHKSRTHGTLSHSASSRNAAWIDCSNRALFTGTKRTFFSVRVEAAITRILPNASMSTGAFTNLLSFIVVRAYPIRIQFNIGSYQRVIG